MAFSSQIFKAPTLKTTPKLKKTMVSSSVFSGVKSANIAKVSYGGLAKAIGSQPKSIDVEKISAPVESPLAGIVSDLQKDVLDLKKSFVTFEERDSTGSKDQLKIQKSFETLVTSLNNTGVVLNQLTDYLVTESKLEQQLLKRKDREEKKEEDRLKKERKEKLIEKDGRSLKKNLLSPVKSVAGKAKSIFDTFKEILTLLFFGWLTDKGFLALELWKKKDEEGLQNLAGEIGKVILGFGSLMLLLSGGIPSIIGAIGAGISATLGIGPAIGNFFKGFRKQVPPKPGGGTTGRGQPGTQVPGGGRTMTPGQISRSNDSFARYTAGRANIGDRLRLIRQGKLGLGALFTTGGFDQSGALKAVKPSAPSTPIKPTGPGASSRRLLQGAKGLKNIARPGAASLLFAGFDYANRTSSGQTQTQAIAGTAAGATGGILGGIGGKLGGTAAGGVAGAVIGGILGSVVPGAGTLAGAALGAKLGSSLGGLAGMLYGGAKGSEAAAKIADGLTGADKKYEEVGEDRKRKRTDSMFPNPANAVDFSDINGYLLAFNTITGSLSWAKVNLSPTTTTAAAAPPPLTTQQILKKVGFPTLPKALTQQINPSTQTYLPSNNPILPTPSVEEEPEVIVQTVPRPTPPTSAAPTSGSEVPDISSSNPNNFYTMYSKVQYNVVA